MSDKREIIDLKPEETDTGEIIYERSEARPAKSGGIDLAMRKILGAVLGIAILATLLVFFVYVVVPVILIVVAVVFLRKIYLSLVR